MPRTLRPTLALASSLVLTGCGARIETPPASLKDEQPRPKLQQAAVTEPVSRFHGLGPVLVTGDDAATNAALALAMFHTLNLKGVAINVPGANWRLSAVVERNSTSTLMTWTLKDEHGNTRGATRHEAAGNINVRTQADAMAQTAAAGLLKLIPAKPRTETRT